MQGDREQEASGGAYRRIQEHHSGPANGNRLVKRADKQEPFPASDVGYFYKNSQGGLALVHLPQGCRGRLQTYGAVQGRNSRKLLGKNLVKKGADGVGGAECIE